MEAQAAALLGDAAEAGEGAAAGGSPPSRATASPAADAVCHSTHTLKPPSKGWKSARRIRHTTILCMVQFQHHAHYEPVS